MRRRARGQYAINVVTTYHVTEFEVYFHNADGSLRAYTYIGASLKEQLPDSRSFIALIATRSVSGLVERVQMTSHNFHLILRHRGITIIPQPDQHPPKPNREWPCVICGAPTSLLIRGARFTFVCSSVCVHRYEMIHPFRPELKERQINTVVY